MDTKFYEKLQSLSRDELLEIIAAQDDDLIIGINRIEAVFRTKLRHLHWDDGSQILERPLTNQELAYLIDEPFTPSKELIQAGFSIDEQRQLHLSSDPVLWAKHYLNANPRVYQILMLRWPSLRKVLRAGRRLGKTWTMSVILLHYAFTHKEGRCLVVAPMKSQVELIYDEILRLAGESEVVYNSIVRSVKSPQFEIRFSNGSTIRFFTSGIRSGGKSDVARGQEAHIIVLDELDMMTIDDLEALYAMLQQTAENQIPKQLIGASTPTGRREKFWEWCHADHFQEFWFPAYVNPFFTKEKEAELREEYTEMGYRHEIEADWGEDSEGVYQRRYIDLAFSSGRFIAPPDADVEQVRALSDWPYKLEVNSTRSFHVMGVDWDKYGAGCNIVVLEVCQADYEDGRFKDRIRLAYREEVPRGEFTLTDAVDRIVFLNQVFNPRHIYVDKGNGEVQVEMLHKYGLEHPESGLKNRVKGIAFGGTIEVRNPVTRQPDKKEMKPFMIDNLTQMLEKQLICFPSHDVDNKNSLYMQFLSYIVARITPSGRPIFEASGRAEDHAHDAVLLAALAITENYGELMRMRVARRAKAISSEPFLPLFSLSDNPDIREDEIVQVQETWGSKNSAPIQLERAGAKARTARMSRGFHRRSF